MSRVYEPRPRKFVSKGAKPRYPKLHRGVEIVGPGAMIQTEMESVPQVVAQLQVNPTWIEILFLTEADEADLSRLARSVAMFCHMFVA